jgi:hypothetical protein
MAPDSTDLRCFQASWIDWPRLPLIALASGRVIAVGQRKQDSGADNQADKASCSLLSEILICLLNSNPHHTGGIHNNEKNPLSNDAVGKVAKNGRGLCNLNI